jgi:hypothetical protein
MNYVDDVYSDSQSEVLSIEHKEIEGPSLKILRRDSDLTTSSASDLKIRGVQIETPRENIMHHAASNLPPKLKARTLQRKTQEEHPIDEENMRWIEQHFGGFEAPRISDASLILLSEAKERLSTQDSLSDMPRTPSYSELTEPILAGFISHGAKELEDKFKRSISNKQLKHSKSEMDLRKGIVHESNPEFVNNPSHQEDLPAFAPYSQGHRKDFSSPIRLFDSESVFEKVDSMHFESFNSSASSWWVDNRVVDLEAMCDDLRDEVRALKQKNKELRESKKKIKEKAVKTTMDFQNTIDQLVAEVVHLENELQETRIMLSDVWEKSQVAQEAARHRRRRNISLRKGHSREIKRLKSQIEINKTRKSIKTVSGRTAGDQRCTRADLTITNVVGQSYISPLKKTLESTLEGKAKERLTTPRVSKVLLKPESDANENCIRKLAEGGFEDTKTIRITVEEMSPAKEPSVISSLEIGESNAEISDLMTHIQKASEQQIYSSLEENELSGFGEKVDVMPSFFTWNKLHPQKDERSTRSRGRNAGHKRRRSWSAPPNREVYISLLKAIARSKMSLENDRHLKRLSKKIQDEATKKLSPRTQRRIRVSTGNQPTLSEKRRRGGEPVIVDPANTVSSSGEEEMFQYSNWAPLQKNQYDELTVDSLGQELGVSFIKPIRLSFQTQRSISIHPVNRWRGYSRGRKNMACRRKSRPRSAHYKSARERQGQSPSFPSFIQC